MAKYVKNNRLSPLIWQSQKINLTKGDLCKLLGIEYNTFNAWVEQPLLIPLKKLVLLAGLFGMPPEELLYILLRNKPQLNKEGSWYLEAIKKKHEGNNL